MTLPVHDGEPIRGLRQALRSFDLSAPLHPILVHFTIALTSASFGFDLIARVFHVASLADAGWWTIAAASLVTVATLVSGVTSRMGIPIEEGEARSYLRAHMALGPFFFGLLVALTIWRANAWNNAADVSWWYLASLATVVIVMTIQGYLGGELVYRYGLDVRGRYRPLPVAGNVERPHTTTTP